MDQLPIFFDIEASSLGSRSYPIEIAWSYPDGSLEKHLILPSGIERWTDWSADAEKIHDISRAELRQYGKSPSWVGGRMNQ